MRQFEPLRAQGQVRIAGRFRPTFPFVDTGGHGSYRARIAENEIEAKFDVEHFVDGKDELRRRQGVAAEQEEIVVRAEMAFLLEPA